MNKKLFSSLFLSLFLCATQLVAGTLSEFYKTQVVHEQHNTPSMGLREWTQSSMAQVIDDMKIFTKEAKLGILKAQSNSLYRKLGIIERLCPHIAVARVLYEQKGSFVNCPLNAIFSSTIAHRKSDRFDEKYKGAMENLLYGIAPYEGAPCRFAHSERAVGIYLLENLKGIVKNKEAKCVVIQIKTSLVPCDDCKKLKKQQE